MYYYSVYFLIAPHFSVWDSLAKQNTFLIWKGVIETILYIDKSGKAGYYELYKQGFVVSRQRFQIY